MLYGYFSILSASNVRAQFLANGKGHFNIFRPTGFKEGQKKKMKKKGLYLESNSTPPPTPEILFLLTSGGSISHLAAVMCRCTPGHCDIGGGRGHR